MRNSSTFAVKFVLTIFFTVVAACGSDDEVITFVTPSNCDSSKTPPLCRIPPGVTLGSTLLRASNEYILTGPVIIGDSDTVSNLTIEPGTKIYATTDDSQLIINYRSRLEAQGTQDQPIIFTSTTTWRGIAIHGNEAANCGDNCPWERNPNFGSGLHDVTYIKIRNAGTSTIASLTLAGIHPDATFENIHIDRAVTDGIHLWGGSANLKYLLITNARLHSLVWDYGYTGRIQHGVLHIPFSATFSSIVARNHPNDVDARPRSNPMLANFTVISGNDHLSIENATQGTIYNSIFFGLNNDCINSDNSLGFFDSFFLDASILYPCTNDANLDLGGQLNQFNVDPQFVAPTNELYITTTSSLTFALQAISPAFTSTVVQLSSTSTDTFSSFFDDTTYMGAIAPDTDWTRPLLNTAF